MAFDNVILDGDLMRGVVAQALKEGYIKVLELDEMEHFVQTEPGKHIADALDHLVLFDRCHLPIELYYKDSFGLERLQATGLVEPIDSGFVEHVGWAHGKVESEAVKHLFSYLRPLLRSEVYRLMKNLGVFEIAEKVAETVDDEMSYYHRRRMSELFCDLLESGWDRSVLEPIDSLAKLNLWAWIHASEAKDSVEHLFLSHYVATTSYLFEQSSVNRWPLASHRFGSKAKSKIQSDWVGVLRADDHLGAYQVFKATIEGLSGFVPKANTIEDVLRLREDTRVGRFRSRLSEFVQAAQSGDAYAMRDLRGAIQRDSKELGGLDSRKKISKWTTYLSLPVSVIEALTGMPPITGLSIAGVGGVAQVASDAKKRKHDWILFGQ